MAGRQVRTRVEADIDRCQREYGVNPCIAGRKDTGVAQAGSANTLTLRAGASAVNDAFRGMTARLTGGLASVQERKISGYVGATKVATVSPNWAATYLSLPGVASNYAGTPDSAVVSIPGDFDIRVKVALTNWTPAAIQSLLSHWSDTGNQRGYMLVLQTTGQLQLWLSTDGTNLGILTYTSTVSTGLLNGSAKWVRATLNVNNGVGNSAATFYLSDDGITWSALGAPILSTIATIFDSSASLIVGGWEVGANWPPSGNFYCAELRNGINGPIVASFNASDGNLGDTSFASKTTGEVWTVNTSGGTPAALAIAPDATTTYDIIDRPNACYKTYRTCQNKPNYLKGVQTLAFIKREDPIDLAAPARAYITAIRMAPTELNFEEGLGRSSLTEIEMTDEPDNDATTDPYVFDRAAPAKGTFWRRFMARNLNFGGRPARVIRTQITDGVAGAPQVERFIIDSISGPDNGKVKLSLKDPVKQLDRTNTPVATTGKLALALDVNDLQATLEAGSGAQYAASGYFRQNDEVIRYSAKVGDVLSWPNGTYRAQFGTAAQAGKVGDVLQQCKVWIDQPFSTVIKELFNLAGMPDADINVAELLAEEANWLGDGYRITTCLADPTKNSELAKELLLFAGMASWWSSVDQQQRFRVYAPVSPSALVPTLLTDDASFLLDSVSIERMDDNRVTRKTLLFGLGNAVANLRQQKSFLTGQQVIDVSAESPNEYNEVRDQVMSSRFFGTANVAAMNTLVRRLVARYRDATEDISFNCDPKDLALKEGQTVDLITARYVDFAGAPKKIRVIVTKKNPMVDKQKYVARVTAFGDRRYGFIAPAGTADFPNNNGYACVSDAAGRMSDSSDAYLVF